MEAFKNFDELAAINIIANTITNNDNGAIYNHNPVFQPIDQLLKLHEEKIALYERMLKEKDEMIERLEKLINK